MSRLSSAQVAYLTSLIFLTPFVVYRALESWTVFDPEKEKRWGLWFTVTLSVVVDFAYLVVGFIGCVKKSNSFLSCNLKMIPLNIAVAIGCTFVGVLLKDTLIPLYGVNIVLLVVSGTILVYLNSLLDPSCFDLNLGI